MPSTNDIVLRPRFKMEVLRNNASILRDFERQKKTQSDFILTRIDNHVFIKFPKAKRQFWSPQLHLEIDPIDASLSEIHGLYGPNPTVWSLFMFLHFMVAGLFIAFGIWTYTNWKLNTDFIFQLSLTILMIIIWVLLYFIGRIGRDASKKDMFLLKKFMDETLNL